MPISSKNAKCLELLKSRVSEQIADIRRYDNKFYKTVISDCQSVGFLYHIFFFKKRFFHQNGYKIKKWDIRKKNRVPI